MLPVIFQIITFSNRDVIVLGHVAGAERWRESGRLEGVTLGVWATSMSARVEKYRSGTCCSDVILVNRKCVTAE